MRWVGVFGYSSFTEPVGLFILLTHENPKEKRKSRQISLALSRLCCNWSVNKRIYKKVIFTTSRERSILNVFVRFSCCIKVIFSSPREFSYELRERELKSALLCLAPRSRCLATRKEKSLKTLFFLLAPSTCMQCHSSECARHINKPIFSSRTRSVNKLLYNFYFIWCPVFLHRSSLKWNRTVRFI